MLSTRGLIDDPPVAIVDQYYRPHTTLSVLCSNDGKRAFVTRGSNGSWVCARCRKHAGCDHEKAARDFYVSLFGDDTDDSLFDIQPETAAHVKKPSKSGAYDLARAPLLASPAEFAFVLPE